MCLGSRFLCPVWSFFMWAKYMCKASSDHSKWCKWIVVVFLEWQIKFHVRNEQIWVKTDSVAPSFNLLYNKTLIGLFPVCMQPSPSCFSSIILLFNDLNNNDNSSWKFLDCFFPYIVYKWCSADGHELYIDGPNLFPSEVYSASKYLKKRLGL